MFSVMLEIIQDDINATIDRLKELETAEYREYAKEKSIDINVRRRIVTENFRGLLKLRDKLTFLNKTGTNQR